MQFVLFTDDLHDLSIEQVLNGAKKAGFDGLDLTLREGGHVLPQNAEMSLAAAKQAADAVGMTIPMAATNIWSTKSPHAEAVFASAAHYGIRFLKLGYWQYEPLGKIHTQIDEAHKHLEGLIDLGKKYNVLPCVHIHSGRVLSNNGLSLFLLLKPFKPGEVGAYIDPMHMAVEGGLSGWEMGLDLVAPWIALVGMKNFRWVEQDRNPRGQMRFSWQFVPLADGQAPLPVFMDYLKQLKYDGPVSLHSEYRGNSSFRKHTTDELLDQSAKDLTYLKSLIQES
jgi:sugar phosphate isomerase/epimerase